MYQLIKEAMIAFGQVLLAVIIVVFIIACIFLTLYGAAKTLQKALDKVASTFKPRI